MIRIGKSFLFLGWFIFILTSPVPSKAFEKHALLIGISDYSGVLQLSSLDGTLNDVELTRNLLLHDKFGFKEDNVVVLTDQHATHSGIEKAMKDMAARVKKGNGGIVYIHYSGHGSQTRNLNEQEQEDLDQTWVSYGARTELVNGIDQWDILDDEIREWLSNISDYADQVILVSDSCHSGSITRGKYSTRTRAAMRDDRPHPLGKKTFREDSFSFKRGVFIGASKDEEQAGEYMPIDMFYGLFTWFWIQNLESVKPGETWHDILRKTRIQVQGERKQQSPQIRGALSDSNVFADTIVRHNPRFPVSGVVQNTRAVTIEHGLITGATIGSIYKLYAPGRNQEKLPLLKLTSCTPFNCSGTILRGSFTKGRDLVIEEQHAYTIEPISLYIDGDFASSGDNVIEELRTSFTRDPVPGYTMVKAGVPHTITLYVTRPVHRITKTAQNGSANVLPLSKPDSEPEVWVLDNTNHLWQDNLRIPYGNPQESWKSIRSTLQKIAKAKEVKRLSSELPPALDVDVTTWRPDPACINGNDCLKDSQGYFRKDSTFPFIKIEEQELREGDSLTFTITSNEDRDMYIYLLNIGPDDGIVVLFPRRIINSDEDARLSHNSQHPIDTKRVGRLVLSAGNETFKIIASQQPIAINYFAQESYTRTGEIKIQESGTRGAVNPFNNLIAAAVGGKTRGKQVFIDPVHSAWGTMQISTEVISGED